MITSEGKKQRTLDTLVKYEELVDIWRKINYLINSRYRDR